MPSPWPQSATLPQTQSHTKTVLIHYSETVLKMQIPRGHLQTNVPKTSVSFTDVRKLQAFEVQQRLASNLGVITK